MKGRREASVARLPTAQFTSSVRVEADPVARRVTQPVAGRAGSGSERSDVGGAVEEARIEALAVVGHRATGGRDVAVRIGRIRPHELSRVRRLDDVRIGGGNLSAEV